MHSKINGINIIDVTMYSKNIYIYKMGKYTTVQKSGVWNIFSII